MKRYLKYFGYVCRHKWFVFLECCKAGIPGRGLIHDLSKFLPDEFIPYARFFYRSNGTNKQRRDKTGYYKPHDTGDPVFDLAWFKHQKRNSHHWQWWIMPLDEEGVKLMVMPYEVVIEMVCDWRGASRAQGVTTGSVREWYEKNQNKIRLHPFVRDLVECIL